MNAVEIVQLSGFFILPQVSGNISSTVIASENIAVMTGSKSAPTLLTSPSAHHVIPPPNHHFGMVCQVPVPSIHCEKVPKSLLSVSDLSFRRLPLNQNGFSLAIEVKSLDGYRWFVGLKGFFRQKRRCCPECRRRIVLNNCRGRRRAHGRAVDFLSPTLKTTSSVFQIPENGL